MTVRVVVAVAFAVALLVTVGPGVQAARERATVASVDADVDRLRAAVAAMADAPRGSRRVLDLTLPASTVGTARVAELRLSARAVRYRLASGRRAGVALPDSVVPVTSAGGVEAAAGSIVLDAPGTYRVVVSATNRGVVVGLVGDDPMDDDALDDDLVDAGEGLSAGTRPRSACSTDPGSVRVRRPSTTARSASTRPTATAVATSRPSPRVAGPPWTRAGLVRSRG